MKEILLSVKPQYANPLVDGTKTIELRKKFPTEIEKGTTIYIYSSFPEKKVIGEVKIKKVEMLTIAKLWKVSCSKAFISWSDFKDYFNNKEFGYAIHVYKAKRYEEALNLKGINPEISQAPQSYRYLPQAI